ncbi:sensor histidine kinase [Chitinimonas sp. BJYL2]|uniref:sensor histidine kinase n=1 Tax=Chitinimonas sp. BJYL2 TaxID=2976696 RepID=UPI0022B5BD94|nr:sensor histidine kinase [Chitinimonas sp. BJYL2]
MATMTSTRTRATLTTATASDPNNWHPLEIIFPVFRRWPSTRARDLLYTLIWNMLLWAAISAVVLMTGSPKDLGRFLWVNFVITQSVGFTIHLLFEVGNYLLGKQVAQSRGAVRALYFIAIPVTGVFVGYTLAFVMLDLKGAITWLYSSRGARSVAIASLIISAILATITTMRAKQSAAEAALAQERQRTIDAERRALEAQLRMLQAQIEPHFLYNTLGNAVGLIDPAPDKARILLERLIDYLRSTLSASREDTAPLERELASVRAYLELMQVRMGDRLRFSLDYPEALTHACLPPMLLQPVVENAIQHGLEPKIDGGTIRIEATQQDAMLRIQITDTGIGFQPGARPRPGGGIGLANLRERLATLYGTDARLTITDHSPSGVCVTLHLPLTYC